jgi:hypothetical protein
MWEVLYTDEFGAWFETLTEDQQDAVIAHVDLLEAEGPAPGRPTVDTIAGSRHPNIKELRVSKGGAIRILFAFDPQGQAVLLIGGDKAGHWHAWYEEAIPVPTTCSTSTCARPVKREGRDLMAARKFKDLAEPIKADPTRAARIARHRAEAIEEIVDYTLGELRRARKITQDELARLMATTQPNVSRIERGGEMELSTLRAYVEALGGRLEVTAVFDDERFPVIMGATSSTPS